MNNKFCQFCGTENIFDYNFCKKCGKPLAPANENTTNPNIDQGGAFNQPNNANFGSSNTNANPPYENTNGNTYNNAPYGNTNGNTYNNPPYGNTNGNTYNNPPYGNPQPLYNSIPDSMEGVNTEDISIFLGKDSPRYLPVFAKLETKKSTEVNLLVLLVSFLVSPFFAAFWFMHKRMNKLGLFLFLILTAFEFGNLIAGFSVVKEVFCSITMYSDPETIMAMVFKEIESASLLSALSSVSQLVSMAVAIVSGLFANKWYKKHVISTIKSITAENEESYKRALVEKGGTRNALWITLLIVTIVAIFVLSAVFVANIVNSII